MRSTRAVTSDLAWVRARLAQARHVACLTGAGISAESGIPTFRDAQTGLWKRYDPEALATQAGFRRDPALVWRWYRERLLAIRGTEPNAGHRALHRLAGQVPRFDLITQNVDDLHERAGQENVLHLHGEIAWFRCMACTHRREPDAHDMDQPQPPVCPRCGGLMRPDVVWFGEELEADRWRRACTACLACDVLLVVGTSGMVQPAADLPWLARTHGAAAVVEVNPEQTPISAVARVVLRGSASRLLPLLLQAP